MMTLFRAYRRLLAPALFLVAGPAAAQVELTPSPLTSDPARAIYAPVPVPQALRRGTTALPLPFFDDFTTPIDGAPKAQNWQPVGGAIVTNRLAVLPLTRGAVTLDGLRANGKNYSGTEVITGNYGAIDSLMSQSINLAGLTASDNVLLSFAWQAGSVVSAPNRNAGTTTVRLDLYVFTDAGNWELAWTTPSLGVRSGFKQQTFALNLPKYLHGNFRFMFIATGSRSSNQDSWSLDYILLNRNRPGGAADTTFVEYAASSGLRGGNISGGLRSPLKRFASMPWWQYNAASNPSSELNPQLGVNFANLRSGVLATNTVIQGTVQVLPNGPVLGTWFSEQRPLPTFPRLDSVTGHANRVALPTTPGVKRLRYTMVQQAQETNPLTLANDSIYRDLDLDTYYAYDDGSAESVLGLPPTTTGLPGAFAYRFDLNQPDYVRGLRMYPIFSSSETASRSVTISVWDNVAGQPSTAPIASQTVTIPNPLPAGWQYFEISFAAPVRVSGSFFVGYSQPLTPPSSGNALLMTYGFDINSTFPAGYLQLRNNGVWQPVSFFANRGALMMRPVLTNNVATATTTAHETASYRLYPNPSHSTVTVDGPAFARAAVLDALGRVVWEQPATQAGQPSLGLPTLPPGLYTVRLTLADGRTVGRRLAIY